MPSMNLWPDGRPARASAKDWSCHGSLGWTLQQALDQMATAGTESLSVEQEDEEDHIENSKDDSQNEKAAVSIEKESQNVTYLNAESSDANKSNQDGDRAADSSSPLAPRKTPPRLATTPQMRQAVLEALATAPARIKQAPHGILKGRIKYYQRQGSRWRCEVEDVRIRRRLPLRKIRRKQEKPSLWDLSREGRQGKDTQIPNGADPSKWTFELLAYNDI